jgi:hypothetical protein
MRERNTKSAEGEEILLFEVEGEFDIVIFADLKSS